MFTLRSAAVLAFVNAAAHFVALVLGGFSVEVIGAIGGGLIWAALSYGLWQDRRAVGYLAFIFSLVGLVAALIAASNTLGIVQTVWTVIVVLDVLTAVVLFGHLWRNRAPLEA